VANLTLLNLTLPLPPNFWEICIQENVFGKTLFYQFLVKLVYEKLKAA